MSVLLAACGTSVTKAPASTAETVSICIDDPERFLSLDYQTFDQDPEKGYRAILQNTECRLEVADLISAYHERLRQAGAPVVFDTDQGSFVMSEDGEMFILYWHEGQLRAFVGEIDSAIDLFKRSIKPHAKNYSGWNEYVWATIAFLEVDLDALKAQRDVLAKVAPGSLNLGAIDGLVACFGKSYADAYGSAECNRRGVPTKE